MELRQLREECMAQENPTVIDTELGLMCVHDCPDNCGQVLSQVECTASCPHTDCEDRQLHFSAGRFWCPLLQIVERRFPYHQEVGLIHDEVPA